MCLAHIYTFKSLAPISIQRHKLLFIWVHHRKRHQANVEAQASCHIFCNWFKEILTKTLTSFSNSKRGSSWKSSALKEVKFNGVSKAMYTHIRLYVYHSSPISSETPIIRIVGTAISRPWDVYGMVSSSEVYWNSKESFLKMLSKSWT